MVSYTPVFKQLVLIILTYILLLLLFLIEIVVGMEHEMYILLHQGNSNQKSKISKMGANSNIFQYEPLSEDGSIT
jgi:hypothetical protein